MSVIRDVAKAREVYAEAEEKGRKWVLAWFGVFVLKCLPFGGNTHE